MQMWVWSQFYVLNYNVLGLMLRWQVLSDALQVHWRLFLLLRRKLNAWLGSGDVPLIRKCNEKSQHPAPEWAGGRLDRQRLQPPVEAKHDQQSHRPLQGREGQSAVSETELPTPRAVPE